MGTLQLGPQIDAVLDAQQHQRNALRYPRISAYAAELASLFSQQNCNLLWPVDLGALKLAGAVEVIACGAVETRSFCCAIGGASVMLLATIAVSCVEMARAALEARAAGARQVYGAAIDPRCLCPGLDNFFIITADTTAICVA